MPQDDVVNDLETSIDIPASPTQVWAVVSDLTDMPKWSPQTWKVLTRDDPHQVGARMLNLNRAGWRIWPTRSKIIAIEPERVLRWRVKDNKAIWSLTLTPTEGGGTKLTSQRDVSDGTSAISHWLIDRTFGGNESFERRLTADMQDTLGRIRAEVLSNADRR